MPIWVSEESAISSFKSFTIPVCLFEAKEDEEEERYGIHCDNEKYGESIWIDDAFEWILEATILDEIESG